MKKLLILVTITFVNLCYASFPVFNSNFAKEPDGDNSEYWGILGGVLFFGTIYLLVRTIWRAYRRGVPWVKKLLRWKNIWWLLLLLPVMFIIGLMGRGSGMGG